MDDWAIGDWAVNDWGLVLAVAAGLFFATALIKTLVGWAVRYVIFAVLAALVYRAQLGEEPDFMDVEVVTTIATIGALSFAASMGIMALLFRNSRFKTLLFPIVGFATTFAAAAMVTYGS